MRQYFFGIIISLLIVSGLVYFLYSVSNNISQITSAQTSGPIREGMKLGTYHESSTDKGMVIVGNQNSTQGLMKPEMTLSKWDNEVKLNISYNIGAAKPTAIDNGITWKGNTQDLIYKETPAKKLTYVPPKKPIIRLADFSNKVRYIKFGPSSLSTIASSYELFEKENSPDPTITTYIPNEDGYFFFGYKPADMDLRDPKDIKYPIVRLKADMQSFSCPVIPFTKNGGFVVRFYYPNIVKNGEMYRQMFVAAMNNALKSEGVDKKILLTSDFLYYLDGVRPVEVGRIGYDTNNLIFYLYTDSPLTSSPLKDNLRLNLVLRDVLFPFSDLKSLKSSLTPDFQDKIVDEFLKIAKYDPVPSTLNTDEQALLRGLEGLQKEPDWKMLGLRSDLPNRIGDEQKFDKFVFDLLLHQKPDNNIFTYDIDTTGLDFFYQPGLTEAQKDEGNYQPEGVAGSYAVYRENSTNAYDNSVDAEKYKTGKVMQIYRPKVTDSKGNMTWGTLNVDTDKHSLSVTVDKNWLAQAAYPVTVDPTFGYTTQGATLGTISNSIDGNEFTTTQNGTITTISVSGGNGCFTGDTLVSLADGTYKQIKDIQVGDRVKSFNETLNIIESDSVLNLIKHKAEDMGDYYLTITTNNNKSINITPNHPVF